MFTNRVTELLGVDVPVVHAPMGRIARARPAAVAYPPADDAVGEDGPCPD